MGRNEYSHSRCSLSAGLHLSPQERHDIDLNEVLLGIVVSEKAQSLLCPELGVVVRHVADPACPAPIPSFWKQHLVVPSGVTPHPSCCPLSGANLKQSSDLSMTNLSITDSRYYSQLEDTSRQTRAEESIPELSLT